MARKRPTASDVPRSQPTPEPRARDRFGLTRAEAHALRRSAPLTPTQFKALRQIAQKGGNPLREV